MTADPTKKKGISCGNTSVPPRSTVNNIDCSVKMHPRGVKLGTHLEFLQSIDIKSGGFFKGNKKKKKICEH